MLLKFGISGFVDLFGFDNCCVLFRVIVGLGFVKFSCLGNWYRLFECLLEVA